MIINGQKSYLEFSKITVNDKLFTPGDLIAMNSYPLTNLIADNSMQPYRDWSSKEKQRKSVCSPQGSLSRHC